MNKINRKSTALRLAYCLILVSLLSLMDACSTEQPYQLFEKAQSFLDKGDYVRAISSYRYLSDNYPESRYAASGEYKIGLIHYLYTGRLDEAMKAFIGLILRYPGSKEEGLARVAMAKIYSSTDEHRMSINEYRWLAKNSSGAKRALFRFNMAVEYQKMSDFTSAVRELKGIAKDTPDLDIIPEVYYQIGTNIYLSGDPGGSIKYFDMVTASRAAKSVVLNANLGKAGALEDRGELAKARELLTTISKEYPDNVAIKTRIAWIEKRITSFSVRKE